MNHNLVDMAVIEAQQALIRELRAENTALKAELERTQYHLAAARADALEFEQIANEFAHDKKVLYECWKQAEERYEQAKAIAADKITAYNIQRHMAQRHAARAAQAIAALEAIGSVAVAAAFEPTTPDSE